MVLGLLLEGVLCFTLAALIDVLGKRWGGRLDFGSEEESAISEFTQAVIRDLNSTVEIAYFADVNSRRRVENLLRQFSSTNPLISTKVFNLDGNPGAARYYGVTKENSAIVEVATTRRFLAAPGEDQLLQAIIALTAIQEPQVYFLRGHGERDPVDSSGPTGMAFFHQRLLIEGYRTQPLDLQRAGQIPADADIVLIAGPQWDLTDQEVESLEGYLLAGGRVLALIDRTDVPRLSALLKRLGVQLSGQIVVDQVSRLQRVDLTAPLIQNFDPMVFHGRQGVVVMPVAQAVVPAGSPQAAWTRVLASSTPTSWSTSPEAALDPALQPRPEAKRGPFPLAVAAGIAQGSHQATVVVVGDSDFATNAYFLRMGNEDFALNITNWLAGRLSLVGKARSRTGGRKALSLSYAEMRRIFWFGVGVVPSLFLAGALGASIRRRRVGG